MAWLMWPLSKKKRKKKKKKKKKKKHQPCIRMAGVVIVDVADVASDVGMGVVVACFVSELISYYFLKKISMQKKKTKTE